MGKIMRHADMVYEMMRERAHEEGMCRDCAYFEEKSEKEEGACGKYRMITKFWKTCKSFRKGKAK